jgi:hypothetical protein
MKEERMKENSRIKGWFALLFSTTFLTLVFISSLAGNAFAEYQDPDLASDNQEATQTQPLTSQRGDNSTKVILPKAGEDGQGISTLNNGIKKETAGERDKPAAKGADEKPGQKVTEAPKPAPEAAQSPELSEIKKLEAQFAELKSATDAENSDFSLVLGIGSLVVNSGITDYENQSNVLHAATLGRATPQLLTGVAFRSPFSNFHKRKSETFKAECPEQYHPAEKPPDTEKPLKNKGDGVWQCRPFSGFVSLKFAPGTSQTLSGYVIGGTYAIGHHLNALVGFALTPIQESAPGFRVAASQFVRSEQTQGRDLNFNPDAMLRMPLTAFRSPIPRVSSYIKELQPRFTTTAEWFLESPYLFTSSLFLVLVRPARLTR